MATIKLKNGSGAPLASDLVQGEPALDLTNKRLYTEDTLGAVIEVGTNPSSITTSSADIDGGSIDGTVIGGVTPAAVTTSSLVATTADIDAGTIDGTVIGGVTPAAVTTTALVATTADIDGGSIDGTVIGGVTPAAVTTSSLVATTADINGGSIDGTVIGGTTPAAVTTSSLVATTADINGGSIDGTVIGGTTPAAGSFTTFTSTGIDDNAASTAMTLDASGNLLVGNTVTDPATSNVNGTAITAGGEVIASLNGVAAQFNRRTSDGDIAVFKKGGTTVGNVGVLSNRFYIGSGDTGLKFSGADDLISPIDASTGAGRDASIDLGSSGARFNDIYAVNGTIQTSDRNEKQDIEALSDAEQRVAVACKGLLRKFRWIDSVEEKGDDARIHFGIMAQDLEAAFAAEGLDAGRYAMFISTTWTDEETGEERTRLGVRYPELLAFIIAAI